MAITIGTRASQLTGLNTYAAKPTIRASQLSAMLVYAPEQVKYVRTSQISALVTYSLGVYAIPETSQAAALVVYATERAFGSRSRAWTFTLDGHAFYVLDLGGEGTFLYDMTTQQWCQFQTDGHEGWNVRSGVVWGKNNRIAGADTTNALVWEMKPGLTKDDGFRPVKHAVTGGLATRSRVYRAVDAVRVTGSVGTLDDDDNATFTMRFSDDNGNTWSDDYVVELTQGAFGDEVAWRSLGSFMAPGRVFHMEDVGGLVRIDGADAFIDGFDGADG